MNVFWNGKKVAIVDDDTLELKSTTKTFKTFFKNLMKRGHKVLGPGKDARGVLTDREHTIPIKDAETLKDALAHYNFSTKGN
jgi:hypothetical protein